MLPFYSIPETCFFIKKTEKITSEANSPHSIIDRIKRYDGSLLDCALRLARFRWAIGSGLNERSEKLQPGIIKGNSFIGIPVWRQGI